MYYQELIHELDPGVNPAGVEAWMRLRHGTLDHLSREEFKDEIRAARHCETEEPGHLWETAASESMLSDLFRWEEKLEGRDRNPPGEGGEEKFVLHMTLPQAEAAGRALRRLGVSFDERRALTAPNTLVDYEDEMTGADLQDIARQINEHLEEEGLKPRLPEETDGLTLEQARDMLALAMGEFSWRRQTLAEPQYPRHGGWEKAAARRPALFGGATPQETA